MNIDDDDDDDLRGKNRNEKWECKQMIRDNDKWQLG